MNAPGPIQVLHVITRLIVGGAQENTLYTASCMDKTRYRLQVVCGPQTGSEGSLIDEARAQGIPVTIIPSLVRQVNPLQDMKALMELHRYIRKGGFTIVHTHSSKAGILGRMAARLAGAPVIVHTVHGWSFHDYMPAITRRLYVLLERWMARFTDAIIVVAENDIDKGLRVGIGRRDQYHLVRSAIPLDEFDPALCDRSTNRRQLGIPSDAPVIGTIGRLTPQKNPSDWMRAAGSIGRARPEAFFLLVGDGPLRAQVEASIAQESLFSRVILTGLRRDVPQLLAAMDIFMLASLWEGLPRTIPEAQAMGLPVVVNRVDGTTEAIQEGLSGYLCTPGDLEGMAERVVKLIDNREMRLEMGQRGRATALAKFDLRKMIEEIDRLYQQLVDH